MDRLTQVALNSMRLMTENQKITTSNLANSSSIGFQRDMSDNLGSVYLKTVSSARVAKTASIPVAAR
jgi:flagellar basal body rod protein FlgF